jgi:PKD repeat protein
VVGESVEFINQSTGTQPLQYLWDFGDGSTSTETSPTHTFNSRGRFQVVLTVQNSAGSDTASATIDVSTSEPENKPLDSFTVSRSIISWHEGDPEPAEYWIFGMFDLPSGVGFDDLTGDLSFRLEIADVSDGDRVTMVRAEDRFGYHERYSFDFDGQEIRDVVIYPVSEKQAIFVVAGQFRLPGITRQVEPPNVRYRLRLPASIEGEIVNLNGVAVIQHMVRTNIWVYGQ